MDIISGISAATEGLKLVNELRKIDKEVDKAELKLRLVEVADKLLDSKQALQDAQEREFDLRKQIVVLNTLRSLRANHRDRNGMLYELDTLGNEAGEPYCNHCFVKDEKLFRLRNFAAGQGIVAHYLCDNRATNIVTGPSLPVSPPRSKGWR